MVLERPLDDITDTTATQRDHNKLCLFTKKIDPQNFLRVPVLGTPKGKGLPESPIASVCSTSGPADTHAYAL